MNTNQRLNNSFWDYKNFLFNNEWQSFYRYNDDLNLTIYQKKLLKAREYCKKNKYDEAIELLSITGNFPNEYFEADRLMVLGMIYLFRGEFDCSLKYNLKAIQSFQLKKDSINSKDLFNCYYNASVSASRLRLEHLSSFYLESASKFASDKNDLYMVKRSLCCYHSNNEEFLKAFEILKELKILVASLSKIEKFQFNLVAADIYIRGEEFDKAKQLFEELKSFKYIEEKDRYFAEIFFLNMIINPNKVNVALLELELENLRELSEYGLRLIIIKCLIKGDISHAEVAWEFLRVKNSSLYGQRVGEFLIPTFKLNSFARCIELAQKNSITKELKNPFKKGTFAFKLTNLLIESKFPLGKEFLIEQTWKSAYSKSFDARFYKLLERVKKQLKQEVILINGAYQILN